MPRDWEPDRIADFLDWHLCPVLGVMELDDVPTFRGYHLMSNLLAKKGNFRRIYLTGAFPLASTVWVVLLMSRLVGYLLQL